jgi:hypothetical protein
MATKQEIPRTAYSFFIELHSSGAFCLALGRVNATGGVFRRSPPKKDRVPVTLKVIALEKAAGMVADNVKTKFDPLRSLGCAAVVAASVALCSCTPKTPGPTSLPSTQSDPNAALSMALERTQLKNGLGVTVLPRPSSRTAAAELYIPALGDYGEGFAASPSRSARRR